MGFIGDDTQRVREEFDRLSTPTQVFISVLVGLGVIVGVLLGGAIGYGVAVEEIDGRSCIRYEDRTYCIDEVASLAPERTGAAQPR